MINTNRAGRPPAATHVTEEEFDIVPERNVLRNRTLAGHAIAHQDPLEVDFGRGGCQVCRFASVVLVVVRQDLEG